MQNVYPPAPHTHRYYTSGNIVLGMIMPPAWTITNLRLSEEQVHVAMAARGLHCDAAESRMPL